MTQEKIKNGVKRTLPISKGIRKNVNAFVIKKEKWMKSIDRKSCKNKQKQRDFAQNIRKLKMKKDVVRMILEIGSS